jgi:hypothetical protein
MAKTIVREAENAVLDEVAPRKPSGPAAAALLGAGIGSTVLGFLVTAAEASPALKTALTLDAGVGPLSGKTLFAVVAYLISWAILAYVWRGKDIKLGPIYTATFILVGLGVLGTFPIFFEAFTVH